LELVSVYKLKEINKMKNLRIILIASVISLTLLYSCSKDEDNPNISKYTIYMAGEYDISQACYWKNGKRTDFGNVSAITGMSVSNGNVYMSGYYNSFVPCYWKNGVKTDLPDDTDLPAINFKASYANGIYAAGNDVYTVGSYNVKDVSPYNVRAQPCYWKNTSRFDITDYPDRFAEATCIFVSGDDIYIGGKYLVPGTNGPIEVYQACYWKNGVKTDLPADIDSYVTDIYVENGKVYAAGSWKNESWPLFSHTRCYWADGQKVDLITINPNDRYDVKAIFVDNGTVYAAGYCTDDELNTTACYWKDGKQTILSGLNEAARSRAFSIYVKDGIVFTSGWSDSKSGVCNVTGSKGAVPCYWVDTKCKELSVKVSNWCDTERNNAIGIFVE